MFDWLKRVFRKRDWVMLERAGHVNPYSVHWIGGKPYVRLQDTHVLLERDGATDHSTEDRDSKVKKAIKWTPITPRMHDLFDTGITDGKGR